MNDAYSPSAWYDHDAACLAAKRAAWELDEARKHRAFDPERYEIAKRAASAAFDRLVAATARLAP